MKDELFIRGDSPMTKEEVRVVSVDKLRVPPKGKVLDIGSGTGSIAVEIALKEPLASIYAVESKKSRVDLIQKNINKFKVKNIRVIHEKAPNGLPNKKFDSIFIGGTGGNMESVLSFCQSNLSVNGTVVINTITIENLYKSITMLKKLKFCIIDITQLTVAKSKSLANLTMMMGQNPIFIISASKGEDND